MGNLGTGIVALAFILGALSTDAAAQNSGAVSPGGVRITARNPLQGNWICKASTCICKPLACGAESRVTYATSPTPARRPDAQALEKFAKVDLPKQIRAANAAEGVLSEGKVQFEMLTTWVSTHLGYPSVLAETKITQEKKTVFTTYALIFVGPVLLKVHAISFDRAVAMKSLNEFVSAMSVEEGPAVSPNAPAPPKPAVPNPLQSQTRT